MKYMSSWAAPSSAAGQVVVEGHAVGAGQGVEEPVVGAPKAETDEMDAKARSADFMYNMTSGR